MEQTNGWEVFEKINYRSAEMSIKIYKGGQIALTKAVHDALGSNYAVLLYNRKQQRVGIQPAEEKTSNAYKLRKPKKQSSWILSASAFLKYYGLEDLKGGKFPASKEEDLIVIDLNSPIGK